MENGILDYLQHEKGNMEVPAIALAHSSAKKGFRESFCVEEVAETEIPGICFGADSLLIVPGERVIGKGLDSGMKQAVITIRRKDEIFLYQSGKFFKDEEIKTFDEECVLIFLQDGKEAYILLKDTGDSRKKLFRFEDDVEICVFLETDLFKGYNGYYACLARDIGLGLNVCSVTADARSAEIYFRFFIVMSGLGRKNE